jgi:hypothetical protein
MESVMRAVMKAAILLGSLLFPAAALAATDWAAVDHAIGRAGVIQTGGVHRYGFPRSDLKVTVDSVPIKTGLALGSWAAFRDIGDHAEVMGDLVLTHDEVNPVLSALLANGFTITALHNHLLRSTPATMYMHIHGHGDAVKLATSLRHALGASATPTGAAATSARAQATFDTSAMDAALHGKGQVNNGVLAYGFPRAEQITENGQPLPSSLGLATAINIQPTVGGNAVTTGDFVLLAGEVDPVLRALRSSGIEVTALHNHLSGEQPRLFFMHFWGNGAASKLTTGLSAALDKMNLSRPR